MVVQQEEFDVRAIAERCVRRVEPRTRTRGVTIALDASSLPTLVGDSQKLERALSNVIENAAKFARTSVEVTGGTDGPRVVVRARVMARPFPQRRRSASSTDSSARPTPAAGAGLGLAIAREFVALSGGQLTLASAASPVEFQFTLPRPAHVSA